MPESLPAPAVIGACMAEQMELDHEMERSAEIMAIPGAVFASE